MGDIILILKYAKRAHTIVRIERDRKREREVVKGIVRSRDIIVHCTWMDNIFISGDQVS